MYTIELDLVLVFSPPMSPHGPGVGLTTTISLPFPPFNGLRLFIGTKDHCPHPEGFSLSNLTWDTARGVFLATTRIVEHECAFDQVPGIIREWMALGWKLGSYRDRYKNDKPTRAEVVEEGAVDLHEPDLDLCTVPRHKRTAEYNRFFNALVRHLAEGHDNSDIAYAMDKSGKYFPHRSDWNKGDAQPEEKVFIRFLREFENLSDCDYERWLRRIRRFPQLTSLACARPPRSKAPISRSDRTGSR